MRPAQQRSTPVHTEHCSVSKKSQALVNLVKAVSLDVKGEKTIRPAWNVPIGSAECFDQLHPTYNSTKLEKSAASHNYF